MNNPLLDSSISVLSSYELRRMGITYSHINRLRKKDILMRSGRGVYTVTSSDITEHHSLAVISKQLPHCTICLLSALNFYNVTTRVPSSVWIAIGNKMFPPKKDSDNLPLRITYMSGVGLEQGITEHLIEGVNVKIYSLPKTIADCFKFRHKIGLDICLEALREVWEERLCTIDEIWSYAKVCRVQKVMRPYLEMLVHK